MPCIEPKKRGKCGTSGSVIISAPISPNHLGTKNTHLADPRLPKPSFEAHPTQNLHASLQVVSSCQGIEQEHLQNELQYMPVIN